MANLWPHPLPIARAASPMGLFPLLNNCHTQPHPRPFHCQHTTGYITVARLGGYFGHVDLHSPTNYGHGSLRPFPPHLIAGQGVTPGFVPLDM
jgi:hypothetical protein